MKQLTYVQGADEPSDKGSIWVKVIANPFGTEMRYFSPITNAWELVEDNRTLELLTDRLNTFGTINPDEINPNLGFKKGPENTDYNNLEVGDIRVNEIYTNDKGAVVVGLQKCTDLSPETWEPFGSADQINQ